MASSRPSLAQPTATGLASGPSAPVPSGSTSTSNTLPPLTTPWSCPQSCTWTYVVDHAEETATPGAVAYLDLEPMPGARTLTCYPDGMFSYGRVGVFSPGTCPSGWTTASLESTVNLEEGRTRTTAICCSYGYTLHGADCRRSVATGLAVPISYNNTAGTYDVLTQSTTTLYRAMLAVSTIRVMFEDEDKKKLGIGSKKTGEPGPLSMTARIGIAVGIGVLILICLGLIYFFLARRRRSREGLTKDCLMRDLKTMHRRGPSASDGSQAGDLSMSTTNSSTHSAYEEREPPPAYDPGRTRRTSGNRNADSGRHRDGEIRALHEQKAVIQQRIDELQIQETSSVESPALK